MLSRTIARWAAGLLPSRWPSGPALALTAFLATLVLLALVGALLLVCTLCQADGPRRRGRCGADGSRGRLARLSSLLSSHLSSLARLFGMAPPSPSSASSGLLGTRAGSPSSPYPDSRFTTADAPDTSAADAALTAEERRAIERQALASLRALPTSVWARRAECVADGGAAAGGSGGGGGGGGGGRLVATAAAGVCAPSAWPVAGGVPGGVASDHCVLCLESYAPGDVIRWLPCAHSFHRVCIDRWLLQTQRRRPRSCPLCKMDPLANLAGS